MMFPFASGLRSPRRAESRAPKEPVMKKSVAILLLASAGAVNAAETYAIDPTHTFPGFEINHLGFSTFRGRFDKTRGTVTLDREKKTGSADIVIEVGSISTGVDKLNEHLLKDDFFDAARYPTITFKSQDFRFTGSKLSEVRGELTMHGVTRPVTLAVSSFNCKEHPLKKVPACGADASATLRRADWGINRYSPNIGEEVTLRIQVEAHRLP
jgi:polyisoprenoid-binding protein YceI